MSKVDFKDLPKKEVLPGFVGQFVHTENNTMAFWEIKAGSVLPLHSHLHEQTTQVLEGKFELTVDNITQICEAGSLAIIPPNAPHSGIALSDCRIFDLFYPVREEYVFES
jgi:quercetin dioxygenase-like cupin family protein